MDSCRILSALPQPSADMAKVRDRSHASRWGNRGRQSGTATILLQVLLFIPSSFHQCLILIHLTHQRLMISVTGNVVKQQIQRTEPSELHWAKGLQVSASLFRGWSLRYPRYVGLRGPQAQPGHGGKYKNPFFCWELTSRFPVSWP